MLKKLKVIVLSSVGNCERYVKIDLPKIIRYGQLSVNVSVILQGS